VTTLSQTIDTLATLLVMEAEIVERFVLLLEQEQDALKSGQTDPLPGLADAKAPLTVELNQLAVRRNQFLASLGLGADKDGVEALLQREPSAKLSANWERMRSAVTKARELNDLNGQLINMRLQYTQQALHTLMATQRQTEQFYGKNGQPSQFTGRRIIDAA
jgi:flagella synthesis protein FlgN